MEAPDPAHTLSRLVQQSTIHCQEQFSSRLQSNNNLQRGHLSQILRCPSRSTEEVIKFIEQMPRASAYPFCLNRFEDSKFGPTTETHQPTKKNLLVCSKRRLSKSDQHALQPNLD